MTEASVTASAGSLSSAQPGITGVSATATAGSVATPRAVIMVEDVAAPTTYPVVTDFGGSLETLGGVTADTSGSFEHAFADKFHATDEFTAASGNLSGTSHAESSASGVITASGNLSGTSHAESSASGVITASFSFPPEWEGQRQEAIRLVGDLDRALQEAVPALELIEEMRRWKADRHGMGSNNPPEEIDAIPTASEITTEAMVAKDVLLAQLVSDAPQLSSIRLAARALRRVAGWVGTASALLVKAAALGFVGGVAKKIGEDNAETIVQHLTDLEGKVTAILTPVTHLFTSLHMIF